MARIPGLTALSGVLLLVGVLLLAASATDASADEVMATKAGPAESTKAPSRPAAAWRTLSSRTAH
jgi:hypothetical protein